MESKGTTYFLIVAFFLIWFAAGYRIYKAVHAEDAEGRSFHKSEVQTKSKGLDTFNLSLNYEDPFSLNLQKTRESQYIPQTNSKQTASPIFTPMPAKSIEVTKPIGISFKGLIKNNTGKRAIAIIGFQGRDYTLSENDVIEGVKLLKIYNRDSISVLYRDQKIIFVR